MCVWVGVRVVLRYLLLGSCHASTPRIKWAAGKRQTNKDFYSPRGRGTRIATQKPWALRGVVMPVQRTCCNITPSMMPTEGLTGGGVIALSSQ